MKKYDKCKQDAVRAIVSSHIRHAVQRDEKKYKYKLSPEDQEKLANIRKKFDLKKREYIEDLILDSKGENDVDLTLNTEKIPGAEPLNSIMGVFKKNGEMSLHYPIGKSKIIDSEKREGSKTTVKSGENAEFYKNAVGRDLISDTSRIYQAEKKKAHLSLLEDFDFSMLNGFSESPFKKYGDYLREHINNVQNAYLCFKELCPEVMTELEIPESELDETILKHDASKWSREEFNPYMEHFYGKTKNLKNDQEFDNAWEHHYKNNPHHPEFWGKEHDMPVSCIIEMLCDWWSFSFKADKLDEIFSYWKKEKTEKEKVMSSNTVLKVERYLNILKKNLLKESK